MTGPNDTLPETAAAENLRRHLEEIARERDKAHLALLDREAELARIQRIPTSAMRWIARRSWRASSALRLSVASRSISATGSGTTAPPNISSFTACRPRPP